MPRLADHDLRRAQITSAARRVIARDGLGAATFQSVAAEAGISVRLVQYYFGTKRKFLLATHHAVVADAGARFARRLSTLAVDPAPRDVIRAILAELLPTDADRRQDAIILATFHAAALTSSEVSAEDTLGPPRFLVDMIAEQLLRVEVRGGTAPSARRTAELDAELIVAGTSGLAQTLLVDRSADQRVDELLDRLLDRMIGA